MLDYTKAAISKIKGDFEKIFYIFKIVSQIITILYLVYTLIAGSGIWVANAILLLLAVAYFGFFLFAEAREADKLLKKQVAAIYKYCRRAVKIFTLGVAVYSIFLTTSAPSPFSILLTVLMLVGLVLQLLLDVASFIINNYFQLIMTGLEADFEFVTKTGNFFKRLAGKEVEPEKEPTKHRIFLNERVSAARSLKKAEKEEKKQRLAAEKAAKKQAKKYHQATTEEIAAAIDEGTEEK